MTEDVKKLIQAARSALLGSDAQEETLLKFDSVVNRRKFLGAGGLLGLTLASDGVLQRVFGEGLIPTAWADTEVEGKPGMQVHNDRPVNGEFAPHMLHDSVTPTSRHFVRNNGLVPPMATKMDATGWTLTIDGEVKKKLTLTLADLKKMDSETYSLLIECGGNGRALFDPPVRGNPWGRGAVSCSQWTGVPLKDILKMAGIKDSAIYTAHYGADIPLGKAAPFSRGIPIEKAMEEHTLVAYKMNGKDIPPHHGFPVRLVVPGWVGSCSQKWLNKITLLNKVHDSPKMTGYSYRVPKYDPVPGVKPPKEDMEIATAWKIKSMITSPQVGTSIGKPSTIEVEGHAWAGEDEVDKVEISIDYGANWLEADLKSPANKYAWQRFKAKVAFPRKGYYEVWARATDEEGRSQPFQQAWNPKGYLGNVMHRIPIYVGVDAHG